MPDHLSLASRVDAFVSRLQREDVNMHGFLLSVDGQEKAKAYYAPFKEGQAHRMYSVSKTMTGIAIGMLVDAGKLSLDDRITDYFRDWLPESPDERLLALTLRDMLRMSTCYRWTTYREGIDENWAKTFFTGKPTHAPGTVFYYDTGCSQVLAALVRRISGVEVIDFLEEKLFAPLNCHDERYWLRDPSGCCQGGTGLCMSLRDLHRVAQCLMDGGEGIVPAWYAQEMGEKHIETLLQANEEEQYGYGWQCWRTRAGFAMYGLGGQLSVICPEKRTILTTIADTRLDPCGVQRIYNAFFEEVYPYIGLEDMDPVSLSLSVHTLPDRPEIGRKSSGVYHFPEGNQLQLKRLSLKENCLLYENARGQVTLPFGRGENAQIAYPGWSEVPALSSGGWITEDLLRIRCYAVGAAPCGFDMLLSFSGNTVTVQSRKSYDPVTEGYDGVASGTLD
ncbi:MAG: beta-lactamase family protein [Clostridia bacterium]|nr:beta-lactamase family protein [Clostridia bacterium]